MIIKLDLYGLDMQLDYCRSEKIIFLLILSLHQEDSLQNLFVPKDKDIENQLVK